MRGYKSRYTGEQIDAGIQAARETLPSQLAQIGSKIGDLTQLQTTAKTNLVGAVNELKEGLDELSPNAEDIIYDDTYSIGVTNAQGAIDAALSEIRLLESDEYTDIDVSALPIQNCSIGETKWYLASGQKHIAIPVEEGQVIHFVYSNSSSGDTCQIAWLSSSYNPPYSNNSAIPFAEGQSARIILHNNDSYLTVPSGASYLAVTVVDGAGQTYTISASVKGYDILGRMTSAEQRLDDLENATSSDFITHLIKESDGSHINFYINPSNNNKWSSSTVYTGRLFDVARYAGAKIHITKNGSSPCRFAFLRSSYVAARLLPDYCNGTTLIEVTSADTQIYDIPNDCKYLYMYTNSNGADVTPKAVVHYIITEEIRSESFVPEETVDVSQYTEQDCSLGSSAWYLVDGQKHIAIPVTEGDVYMLKGDTVNNPIYGLLSSSYSPPYVNNAAIPYANGENRSVIRNDYDMVTIPSGCAYLCLVVVDGTGTRCTWTVKKGSLYGRLSLPVPVKLRVAHWNVGHFSLGTHYDTRITHDNYEVMRQKWAVRINSIDADIMMCCEYNTNFVNASGDDAAITARNAVFTSAMYSRAYIGTKPSSNSYSQQALFSNMELADVRQVTYPNTTQAGRYYLVGTMMLNGVPVKVVETHLDFNQGTTGEGNRALQIQKLIADFADDDYVIIGGDFNVASATEYDSFANAWYRMMNHGYLGDIKTAPSGDSPTSPIDNIMCKGFAVNGIQIVNDAELSDHCCIYADLTML